MTIFSSSVGKSCHRVLLKVDKAPQVRPDNLEASIIRHDLESDEGNELRDLKCDVMMTLQTD